jgi:C-terminal processing protease CtpA/Prc
VKLPLLVGAALAVALAQVVVAGAQLRPDSVSPEVRLLGAMKLWGDIRFFDPQVSEGGVDWDAAFMNAEPAILAATTRDSYAAAVGAMLAPLRDPATHLGSNAEDSWDPPSARITVAQSGSASIITIEHATHETSAAFDDDATRAVNAASKSRLIVFDLRGVTEANAADDAALSFFLSNSPIVGLLSGEVSLPRGRSRSYHGYPDESGDCFQCYTAENTTSDAAAIEGKSKSIHRFGFLVDESTSLPPLAIALASAGSAAIYSTHGQPSVLSTDSFQIELPDELVVTYRTAELADVAERQPFASAPVSGVTDAIARLQAQPLVRATYAPAPPGRFVNAAYADQLFPSESMRMLAVARIYNVIRYFSPYFALMHDDWDAAAVQAIRDERAATDARSYVLSLMKFYAHLHDSHGFVDAPVIYTEFGAGAPFRARYLRGQAVVTQMLTGSSGLHGVRVGDVVDAVDGTPMRLAMDRIEPYLCSSTPQAADSAALWPAFAPSVFSGRKGTTMTLRFHHPGMPATTTTFVRAAYTVKPGRVSPKYMVLAENVGYVDLDRLELTEVDAMFNALQNTRAIVFDNRGYPASTAPWMIAPRLTTSTSVRAALFRTPLVIEPLDAQQGDIQPLATYRQFYQTVGTASGPRYLKPSVMLIDQRAISAAEHLALFFHAAGRTRFVGTPTDGANGDVTSMSAPGNVWLNFSGEGVWWPDGRQLQRLGVIPDVRAEPSARDVATGNDVVLQRGLDEALRLSGAPVNLRRAAVEQEIARERKVAGR